MTARSERLAESTKIVEQQGSQLRVALVTGAGRGIGRTIAVALAHAGYALCLAARTFEQLAETRAICGLEPRISLIVLIDLAESDAPENLIRALLDHYGRLDVLINNAGFAPPRTPLVKISPEDQDRMLSVNLRAPIALARMAAGQMMQQPEGGIIINIASITGRNASAGESVYAAAKSGLIAFTHATAAEFRNSRIRTSVILPGLTDTSLIPQNKRLERTAMLQPADVATAVMGVLNAPPHVCPLEVVLQPARDPMRSGH
ncbi:MAG TPA: SDR family oxidoreductase [Candidatus Binataceae bacterium]|nr:SDR family oxidoreductase [Candidatus Binataceae bacterium]